MCELLGLTFNMRIDPKISFTGFRLRGEENPDGWGVAFYPDISAQIYKEPIAADKSVLSKFVKEYSEMKSKIFISHVRYITQGEKSYRNTHPFMREFTGKNYVFAHNGTVRNYERFIVGNNIPIGETDSEHIFCHLLYNFIERSITMWSFEDFSWLREILASINESGKLNCLFSDGKYLFCYHDINGYKGLSFVHRKAPFNNIKLIDNDWEINLAEVKSSDQIGYIIATKPLTNESWQTFEKGELLIFKDGKIVYSNCRKLNSL